MRNDDGDGGVDAGLPGRLLVLGRLGSTESACSQGGFQEFRERMIRNDMDRRIMEKTIALARNWRRAATIKNLETVQRELARQEVREAA